jgi:hypothetical protein
MTRYGYYDSKANPKAPIDELSTGGPLATTQDPADYEVPAAEAEAGPAKRSHHAEKAGAKS